MFDFIIIWGFRIRVVGYLGEEGANGRIFKLGKTMKDYERMMEY